MKKILAFLLATLTLVATSPAVFAVESTTTLSTTVPGAQYTLNIPADQEIAFGATDVEIGNVTVTESSGFAEGKNVKVTINWTDFASSTGSASIPMVLYKRADTGAWGFRTQQIANGAEISFPGKSDGTVNEEAIDSVRVYAPSGSGTAPIIGIGININSTDWGKALGGDYTATITFTAEVVVAD